MQWDGDENRGWELLEAGVELQSVRAESGELACEVELLLILEIDDQLVIGGSIAQRRTCE